MEVIVLIKKINKIMNYLDKMLKKYYLKNAKVLKEGWN